MPILDSKESLLKYICNNWAIETVNKFESAYVAYLDINKRLIQWELFNTGTIDSCTIDVQKLMRNAVAVNAAGLVVAHNHPDGKTKPSSADLQTTEFIYRNCQVLGIELIDHVIVSTGDGPHSFKSAGLIESFEKRNKQYNDLFEKGTFTNIAHQIVDEFCTSIAHGKATEVEALQKAKYQLEKIYIKFFDPII